jgi:ribA/ribD-fused uncharacterized protein
MDMVEAIVEFKNDYRFLSNFWPVGSRGLTIEHYYQAAKTKDWAEKDAIYRASTPGQAKHLGLKVTLRSDWEENKDAVMLSLLRWKFEDAQLREMLLDTGDAALVEGNTWGDTYWGVDLRYMQGQNMLGILLMQVRDEIRLGYTL